MPWCSAVGRRRAALSAGPEVGMRVATARAWALYRRQRRRRRAGHLQGPRLAGAQSAGGDRGDDYCGLYSAGARGLHLLESQLPADRADAANIARLAARGSTIRQAPSQAAIRFRYPGAARPIALPLRRRDGLVPRPGGAARRAVEPPAPPY